MRVPMMSSSPARGGGPWKTYSSPPCKRRRRSSPTRASGDVAAVIQKLRTVRKVGGTGGDGTRVYSGFGGQTDFIVGAMHSPGGRAIIALRSWHPRAGVSTVVPLLSGPVTSFQHSAIVTEQGCADVWGREAVDQAQQILDHAAHPDARADLREAGRRLGLALH